MKKFFIFLTLAFVLLMTSCHSINAKVETPTVDSLKTLPLDTVDLDTLK